jgi:hypothetical protein
MTITPDFGRNDVYGAAFDSEATWVYRVGDRADSLVISEHPSSAEASSQVSTPAFSGTLGPDPAASTNFYAFVSGHYLIAYFHHKNGPVGAVEAFSRVFGKPSRIAHWNVGP